MFTRSNTIGMNSVKEKHAHRVRRHKRIRTRVKGTSVRPRLSVYKSNQCLYAQLIDDEKGTTLAAAFSKGLSGKNMTERSASLGKDVAKKAKTKKINNVVFDRGGFLYAGNIKAFADAARESGLTF